MGGFVKVLKNKAYSKRYQTKFRRRRQGKTDYFARKRLVCNDKDKYDTKKYRLVVRFTNRRVITAVVYSTIKGDMTVSSADSKELKKYGVTCGLTNYAAAYATGLLLARRLLKEKKMDSDFQGESEASGSLYNIAGIQKDLNKMSEKERAAHAKAKITAIAKKITQKPRRPFKAYLDVGLVRTTTGNRVFGAMKGACDGGLNIPHNEQRFPGFHWEKPEEGGRKKGGVADEKPKPKAVFEAETHLEHILGSHVQDYMDLLKAEDPAKFKKQFSVWTKALGNKKVADLYKAAHTAIRKDPVRAKNTAKQYKPKVVQAKPVLIMTNKKGAKWLRMHKIGKTMRRERVLAKVQKIMSEM